MKVVCQTHLQIVAASFVVLAQLQKMGRREEENKSLQQFFIPFHDLFANLSTSESENVTISHII